MALYSKPELGEIKSARELGRIRISPYGKLIWHACLDCGKERWVQLVNGKPVRMRCKSCAQRGELHYNYGQHWGEETKHKISLAQQGTRSFRWKGGRTKINGYIKILLQPDDFFYSMANQDGYVLEHRLVMGKHLGRSLHQWELVHHRGIRCKGIQNRSDNLIDNLQLISDDRHKQITLLENRIKHLEGRVTLLEAENILLKQEAKVGSF